MPEVEQLVRRLRADDQRGMGRAETMASGISSIDRLAELEAEATTFKAFDHQVIPALLQTPEYSAAVIRAAHPNLSDNEIEYRAVLKMGRVQQFLTRTMNPAVSGFGRACFVIGEQAILAALRNRVHIQAGQLRHLLMMSANERLSIQVLPTYIVPNGFAEHFTLYGFMPNGDGSTARVGFLETIMGDWYSTKLADVTKLSSTFNELSAEAMSAGKSRRFIREVLQSWRVSSSPESTVPTWALGSNSAPTPIEGASE